MRIALGQLTSTTEVDQNLAACRSLTHRAAETGARWVLFPENAPFLGRDVDKVQVAEPIDGPMVEAYREMADTNGVWLTLGSFPEKIEGSKKTYNTQLLIDPAGEVISIYRKIHMFDVEVEGGLSYRESEGVEAGTDVVTGVVEVDGAPTIVGLTTCYDLRFPELYRAQVSAGAKVLLVPAAFTLQTGRDHWHPLLQARAIENQCWVLAPGQFGNHFGTRWSFGHSAVYDPWGRMVACASDRVGLTYAEIDLELVEEVRRKMPCLQHRRIDVLD